LGSVKPGSIAKRRIKIQIVDTHESLATRVNIGFTGRWHQINRTLLLGCSFLVSAEVSKTRLEDFGHDP
ncbi:MAG: hypothetical protein FWG56_05150, partial [Desulfovibrionaceae bacterium]|nr:hypothetical protein [Desulfovibrionaceae bacterium]